jgi:hypothetical protein
MEMARVVSKLTGEELAHERNKDWEVSTYDEYWRIYDTRLMVVAAIADTEEDIAWALSKVDGVTAEDLVLLKPHQALPGD